ncbi:MAG: AraC family transcriptional regulator [Ignavibacteriales bacterium]|nr:MAG: AraC family transcriptional regulator [Ignavibacteriales bacterium]
MKINIKNMVCNRCIKVVSDELHKLGHEVEHIELGEVELKREPTSSEFEKIKKVLEENGFELIEDSKKRIIEQIKNIIISKIHHSEVEDDIVFSKVIEKEFNKDYSQLSKIFSSIEQITIEHFIILQKIEKVKEYLRYREMTLSEIAYRLGYKSVNHLSNQFKKYTGLTATEFKENTSQKRKPLDQI